MRYGHIVLVLCGCSVIFFYLWIAGSALSQLGNPTAKTAYYKTIIYTEGKSKNLSGYTSDAYDVFIKKIKEVVNSQK